MKMSNAKFPTRSESPGVPENASWIDAYSEPRDANVKTLVQALQKQLSFGDNFNAEIREMDVIHDTDTIITLQTLRGVPIGAIVLWTELFDYHDFKFQIIDQKRIKFAVFFDSEPTEESTVRLLFIGQ